MLLWLILPRFSSPEAQLPAIGAFSLGPVVALPLTLGVPALLPNAFRRTKSGSYESPGAWIPQLRIAFSLCVAAMAVGLLTSTLGLAINIDPQLSLTAAYAGAMGIWLTSAQIARVNRSIALMLLAGVLSPLLPLVWIIGAIVGLTSAASTFACVALIASVAVAIVYQTRSLWSGRPPLDMKAAISAVLSRSTSLVPHLLMFAVIAQGIRVSALMVGAPATMVELSHVAMLGVGASSVLINSVHAFLAASIQSTPEEQVGDHAKRAALLYGILVLVGTTVVLVYFAVLNFAMAPAQVSHLSEAILALCAGAIAAYYGSSTVLLRYHKQRALPLASGSAITLWAITSVAIGTGSLDQLSIAYGVGVITLTTFSWTFAVVLTPQRRRSSVVGPMLACAGTGVAASAVLAALWASWPS